MTKKHKSPADVLEYPLVPVETTEVTHSVVELPKSTYQDPLPAEKNSEEQEINEYCETLIIQPHKTKEDQLHYTLRICYHYANLTFVCP